jgi:hypothetical protein
MYPRRFFTLTPLLLLCASLLPAIAAAEPVRVTGGTFHMVGAYGNIRLTGERGLALEASVYANLGHWSPAIDDCFDPGCGAGPRTIRAHWSGGDLMGSVAFDGYSSGIGSTTSATAWVDFAAMLDLPPPGASPVTLVTPFTFSGHLNYEPSMLLPPQRFVGDGWTTVLLSPRVYNGVPLWSIRDVRFDFTPEPIPEPTTLLLVGGAGVALAAARRRRRSGRG